MNKNWTEFAKKAVPHLEALQEEAREREIIDPGRVTIEIERDSIICRAYMRERGKMELHELRGIRERGF